MSWKGTELIIRIAADLKKYRDGLREAAQETRQQMATAARSTEALTSAQKGLEGQASRTARELLSAGRAAANGDYARAGQDVAQMASQMGRASTAASGLGLALGVATAALAGYLVISYKASAEHERQANLMALTGNAAGLLAGDVNRMATSVASSANTTVGAARDILEALLGTGKVGKAAMESMAESIALVSRASGESEERVTADFAKMADGVTKWAVEHNERYHFLTVDQYRYIKSLEEAGRTQEAMIATTAALNRHLGDIDQNVGYLQGAWRGLAKAASSAWDAMLNWGRADTTADKLQAAAEGIAETRRKLEYHQSRGYSGPAEKDKALLEAKLQAQSVLQSDAILERRSADAKAASAAATTKQIAAEEESSKSKARSAASSARLTDAEREAAKAAQELARARVAAQALTDRAGEQYAKAADAVMESNQALREEIAAIGANTEERMKLVLAKEDDIIASKELELIALKNAGADAATLSNLQREITLRKERRDLMARKMERENAQAIEQETTAAIKAMGQRADTEWDRTADYLADALSGAIMAAFDSSEGFADGFVKYLARQLKSALSQELNGVIKGAQQYMLTGNTSGFNNTWTGAAYQYLTGSSAGATGASLAYANAVGAVGGDSIGALYTANGGWAGVSTGTGAGAGAAGSAGAGSSGAAASGGTSMMAYAGYAALIYAAVKYAEKLYGEGYNRNMLGDGQAESYTFGRGNRTSGYTDDAGYKYTPYKYRRELFDAVGMSEKWADILSSTTRWAHMFGRKLKGYGYSIGIDGGNVDVGGYETYKAGWAGRLLGKKDKNFNVELDGRDTASVALQVGSVRESAKAMAQAMGYAGDAIDNYTGRIKVNFKGAETAAEQAERMQKAMDDLQWTLIKTATGGKMAKKEFERLMEGVNQSIEQAGMGVSTIADVIAQGMTGRMSAAQVGERLSEIILGGIYNVVVSPFAGQIAQAFTAQIIQPMLVAVTTGGSVSAAVSQATIRSVVAQANAVAGQLSAILADPGFRAAMAGISTAISGVAAASVKPAANVRSFGSAVASTGAAANQAAAQIRSAWRSIFNSLIEEIRRLRGAVLGDSEAGAAYALAQFTTATAQARAGSRSAASELPELSRAAEEAYLESASSRSDANAFRGYLLEQNTRTAELIGKKYKFSMPTFAEGGDHLGGVRLVGERGPEIEMTGPARYWSAEKTERMLGGSDPAVLFELRQVRALLAKISASSATGAAESAKTRQALEDIVSGRTPILTRQAA